MVTKDNIADKMNIKGTILSVIVSLENKSTTKIFSLIVFHKLNTKIKPPETNEASNK